MTNASKTLIFVVAAIAMVLLAVASRPGPVGVTPEEQIGQPLFPKFTDPLAARGLEIVKYNEELGQISKFRVAEINGQWVIPSQQNYPADAEDQLRDVATSLIDLKVIGIASDEKKDHSVYAVLEPDAEKTKSGEKGVGTLIIVQDAKGKDLARMIIGKAVKGQDEQRFVRVPAHDRVYVVKYDPSKLSTEFGDWIEKDLLALTPADVAEIELKDYSVQTGISPRGGIGVRSYDQRSAIKVSAEDGGSGWKLDELLEFRGDALKPTKMLDSEELNTQKLNDMKTALGDLKIVDVERKPKGLGADLKAETSFLQDQEGVQSLMERGFYPVRFSPERVELLSSDGEAIVSMKDGVQYVLRFGQVASLDTNSDEGKLNRFLFVTARVDDEKFAELDKPKQPEPKPAPEANEDPATPEEAATENSQEANPATDGDEEENQEEEEPTAEEAAAEDKPAEKDPADDKPADDKPADEQAADAEAKAAVEAAEKAVADAEKAVEEARLQTLADERELARTRVRELNIRFADWYYVIPEDEYKKIHLGRDDIFQEKAAGDSPTGTGLEDFRNLQQGLENNPPGGRPALPGLPGPGGR